ncbi:MULTISPECIES: YhcG family protein [Fusobacterium]|jgi:hypothetical protein|uniref:PDDEXK nuclease domain-containing protein n=1 Tax=Fusobacterium TaxID=848 RepID=UPI000452CD8A|nr:PDDEXK nuclease domain-containing protein [Fusobacterium sp. CM22]EUB28514.1 PF06250 family protein [Fusobacterium sp. CM22]
MKLEIKKDIYEEIHELLSKARQNIISNINSTMTKTYFLIGKRIVEEEQNGNKRAEYGKNLIKILSKKLTKEFQLSWSHYLILMRIENISARNFYEIEAIQNNWSLRELKRQVNSALYERLVLSKDKEKVKELAVKGQIIEKPQDIIKDPYILEFLGLDEKSDYSENKLETEIINKLEMFLLELGKGFTFVGRQVRFTFDERHFRVDLVFYNRLLKCFVLIDLKIGEVTHQDLGQMQMYVNYYDRCVKLPDENETIGIIICKDKNDTLVKLTLPKDNNQIFASRYTTILPSLEEFKKIVEE